MEIEFCDVNSRSTFKRFAIRFSSVLITFVFALVQNSIIVGSPMSRRVLTRIQWSNIDLTRLTLSTTSVGF